MNLCVVLGLQVFAILAFTGSSFGDAEISCPITLDEGEGMKSKLFAQATECLDTTGDDGNQVLLFKTVDEHKDFFKNYCGKQPQIRECWANVARTSLLCQDQAHHEIYQTFRDLLETALEAGCVQDGEVFANMVMIYKHNTSAQETNVFYECFTTYAEKIGLGFSNSVMLRSVSDFSKNYIIYGNIKLAKECFNNINGGDQHIKNGIVTLLNEVVEKYKCFEPQNDSVLLCKDLDNKQPKVCPIISKDDQTSNLYRMFFYQLPMCISASFHEESSAMSDLADLEKSLRFFKHQCDKKNNIMICLEDISSISSLCIDATHQLMVETVKDLMSNVLENFCKGEGRFLAEVATKIVLDAGNTTQQNALKECKDVAIPSTEVIDENFTSEKTFGYYNKLKHFKMCLLIKLIDDLTVVAWVDLILSGIINNMKCPNPEHTSLVLCDTIANTA